MNADSAPTAFAGTLDEQGNRFWTVDVSGMLPVYRDIYERVFLTRLRNSGVGADGFVRRRGSVLDYGGPDEMVRQLRPATTAAYRLTHGDGDWVTRVDSGWREIARKLDGATSELHRRLVAAEPAALALGQVIDAKVELNAVGVDSMLPDPSIVQARLASLVDGDRLGEVVSGCYLPTSGAVAFDDYELESLILASGCVPGEAMPLNARRRFVQNGLFYRYGALDTGRRERVLFEMPQQAASAARRSARGGPALAAAIEQISNRAWRRRYHRQWAYQQLDGVAPPLLTLFDFAGSARDYDERKRHLNMAFWRALFMVGDGLRIDLKSPGATVIGLCEALERERPIPLDPVFSAPN